MHYVYLLQSEMDKEFYIGCCADLKSRFVLHNAGKVPSTKSRRPFSLIYFEAYNDKVRAFDREKKLKSFGSSYTGLLKRLGYK